MPKIRFIILVKKSQGFFRNSKLHIESYSLINFIFLRPSVVMRHREGIRVGNQRGGGGEFDSPQRISFVEAAVSPRLSARRPQATTTFNSLTSEIRRGLFFYHIFLVN